MTPMLAWIVGIPLLGALTGNRSMTPIAVVCWFAWTGHLDVAHTWGFWAGRGISVIIFTVFALGEFIGDKLPKTPNRTAAFPLMGRVVFGGLCGALAATHLHAAGIQSARFVGALLGAGSALVGTFLGFQLRQYLVKTRGLKDLYVALAEDVATVFLAVWAMRLVTG